jgi:hypothetical protein
MIMWEIDQERLARLMIMWEIDQERLTEAKGFQGESWIVQVKIVEQEMQGALPADEEIPFWCLKCKIIHCLLIFFA